eukprot:scaffold358_cov207-Alexandrium_tamarense.AAC.54
MKTNKDTTYDPPYDPPYETRTTRANFERPTSHSHHHPSISRCPPPFNSRSKQHLLPIARRNRSSLLNNINHHILSTHRQPSATSHHTTHQATQRET